MTETERFSLLTCVAFIVLMVTIGCSTVGCRSPLEPLRSGLEFGPDPGYFSPIQPYYPPPPTKTH